MLLLIVFSHQLVLTDERIFAEPASYAGEATEISHSLEITGLHQADLAKRLAGVRPTGKLVLTSVPRTWARSGVLEITQEEMSKLAPIDNVPEGASGGARINTLGTETLQRLPPPMLSQATTMLINPLTQTLIEKTAMTLPTPSQSINLLTKSRPKDLLVIPRRLCSCGLIMRFMLV